jgi:acetyl/propionyl-CoA carboxylase alpha subunit
MNRVLVANRGEIARRVFATCRSMGISTAAVYSDPDTEAMHVREADVAIRLKGSTPADSYLRADAVIDAAVQAGADAVHPGYGFLAENAAFARRVVDAGLTWIGPSPEAIAAMGSKTAARRLMEEAGVPVLPAAYLDGGDPRTAAATVGYPLLVKASAGGGGKGMRVVESPDDLIDGLAAARREAAAAFGDDTVFLERFVPRARHVEIQIVGDRSGRVVAYHERDCSIQRRHQKVIEEAPSPVLEGEARSRMAAAAETAGRVLHYLGAGTVEFLYLPDSREFYFLEVNTRLQVEHPVTELVTRIDLVELQLRVARGEPVPDAPPLAGHAIEARIYAEDPARDFLPVTGTIERFWIPPGVRVDTGVQDGSVISPYYDPMIAKVIAHGQTRQDAARRLADALARAHLHGMKTNRDFLVRILCHPEFLAGRADTGFIERHDLSAPLIQDRALPAAAAALAGQAHRRAAARALGTFPTGWRNNPSQLQTVAFEGGPEIGYRFDRHGRLAELQVDGEPLDDPRLHECTESRVVLEVAGARVTFDVAGTTVNTADGQIELMEAPRFADPSAAPDLNSLASPMPGTVVRVMVKPGEQVTARQPLLALEAMKMEHEIVAPTSGVITELRVRQGAQVVAGELLAVIDDL